jgi:hypothetical protein
VKRVNRVGMDDPWYSLAMKRFGVLQRNVASTGLTSGAGESKRRRCLPPPPAHVGIHIVTSVCRSSGMVQEAEVTGERRLPPPP